MPTQDETLKRLATTFTVKDVMIPSSRLMCADDEGQAPVVSDANPDFNVIPIRRAGKVTGYFGRNSRSTTSITPSDLISDGTNLLDLVLVKLTFYVLLAALERLVLEAIKGKDDRESLKSHLNPGRFNYVEKRYKEAGEAARSLVSYLNISELLGLAGLAGAIQVEKDVAKAMLSARDGASHATKNLVSSHSGVRELVKVKRECQRVLGAM